MAFVKRSLILIGASVAVFFIITTVIAAELVSNFSEEQAYRLMYSNMKECVLNFENTLSAPSKMVETLAGFFSDGFYDDDADTNEVFEKMSLAYSDFPGFYGASADGTMYHSANITPPRGYRPSESAWYKGAVEKEGETSYSDMYVNELTDT
ncbi:MAG: cache domain-containing protein, partial [Treponema sp.]|nr:cache domain-containing protein [Treponema sp.]